LPIHPHRLDHCGFILWVDMDILIVVALEQSRQFVMLKIRYDLDMCNPDQ